MCEQQGEGQREEGTDCQSELREYDFRIVDSLSSKEEEIQSFVEWVWMRN